MVTLSGENGSAIAARGGLIGSMMGRRSILPTVRCEWRAEIHVPVAEPARRLRGSRFEHAGTARSTPRRSLAGDCILRRLPDSATCTSSRLLSSPCIPRLCADARQR